MHSRATNRTAAVVVPDRPLPGAKDISELGNTADIIPNGNLISYCRSVSHFLFCLEIFLSDDVPDMEHFADKKTTDRP